MAKKASVLKRRKSRTQIEKGCLEVGRRDSDNDVVFYDEEARQTGTCSPIIGHGKEVLTAV